ncbi:MAG: hypothetical protein RL227_2353 [Pseudomonadota bacterium]|jgi:hypothetical protein
MRKWRLLATVLGLLALPGGVQAQAETRIEAGTAPCADATAAMPPRAAQARGAQAFIAALAKKDDLERDAAILHELMAGNLPGFLRRAVPATLRAQRADGRGVELTLCVLSDYLGLGSEGDFMAVPLSLGSALAVAAKFGFLLPTPRMVDLIYSQAGVQLQPQPLPAGRHMRGTAYLQRHAALVARQRAATGAPAAALTAGHKKDLVLSRRLWLQPGRVAIYGWQRANGAPIQPLSTVHGAAYADYSHGVRLVSQTMFIDGRPARLLDVLADAQLGPLLSDEGALPQAADWLAAQRAGSVLQQRKPRW